MSTTAVLGLPPVALAAVPVRAAPVAPPPPAVGDTWYRYKEKMSASFDMDGDFVSSHGPYLHVHVFYVDKVTPKGVWIQDGKPGELICERRFVLLSSRKQFAAPTKEAALRSFMARKARQSYILERQLSKANMAHRLAELELSKLTGIPATENNRLDIQFLN